MKDEETRKAFCTDCNIIVESGDYLPYFCATPDRDMDHFYCGCFGAD